MKKSGYGWRKDKFDPTEPIHKMRFAPHLVPPAVSWEKYAAVVRDQGAAGSCTGFGIGGVITTLKNKLGLGPEWFSPEWIYNGERYIEGTLPEDAGAEPGDGFDWLKKMGCLLEAEWPYDGFERTSPPGKYDAAAAKWPMKDAVRVTGDADGICDAIAAGTPVAIGTPWFKKWEDIPASGKLPEVTENDEIAGGHETFLFGYDKNTQGFPGQNSWGNKWGNAGRYIMPFSALAVFKRTGGYDVHYPVVEWGSNPAPTPSPTPTPRKCSFGTLRKLLRIGRL